MTAQRLGCKSTPMVDHFSDNCQPRIDTTACAGVGVSREGHMGKPSYGKSQLQAQTCRSFSRSSLLCFLIFFFSLAVSMRGMGGAGVSATGGARGTGCSTYIVILSSLIYLPRQSYVFRACMTVTTSTCLTMQNFDGITQPCNLYNSFLSFMKVALVGSSRSSSFILTAYRRSASSAATADSMHLHCVRH